MAPGIVLWLTFPSIAEEGFEAEAGEILISTMEFNSTMERAELVREDMEAAQDSPQTLASSTLAPGSKDCSVTHMYDITKDIQNYNHKI